MLDLRPGCAEAELEPSAERWSTVTAIFASTPGWRYVLPVTMQPIRTVLVASAIAPSSVHASRMSPVVSSRIEAKWSKFQTWSKPALSATRQIARSSSTVVN